MMTTENKSEQMLYIHIPFCCRKCYYCSFVSKNEPQLWDSYFEALYKEIRSRKNDILVTSIYFGGGTPSIVEPEYIQKCMQTIRENFNISPDAEITMEANPTLDFANNAYLYKQMGFNRISFGVQSLDQNKLELLGRLQNTQDVLKCLKTTKKIFQNISVDLMLGLQGQTEDEILRTIDILDDVGISHYSVYMLMIEDGTPLKKLVEEKKYIPLTDEQCVDLYDKVFQYLKTKNVHRYEISNYAKDNYYSRHNLGYWQMKNYLGFGASAHSFENNRRYYNSSDLWDYINFNHVKSEFLTKQQINEEYVMLGLRTKFGVAQKFVANKDELKKLLRNNIVKKIGNNIVICDDFFCIANQIVLKLI